MDYLKIRQRRNKKSSFGQAFSAISNSEIAKVFQDIAELLKLKKDNIFKIRAYEKVAKSIEQLSVEVEQLAKEGRLKAIPGVGEAISKKITELVASGRLDYYEKLKSEMAERMQ